MEASRSLGLESKFDCNPELSISPIASLRKSHNYSKWLAIRTELCLLSLLLALDFLQAVHWSFDTGGPRMAKTLP